MASKRQISVGGVKIGGGAPVVVQSMTTTKTHDVEATTAQIAELASRRLRDRPRRGSEDGGRGGALEDRPLLAGPDHRRHPLQREPRAEGDRPGRRGRAHQPRQHRRLRQGRRGRARREGEGDPDADRRELRLAAEASRGARAEGSGGGARRGRARGGAPAREPRLLRLQDLGQVEPRADDDPRLPDALGEGRVPAPPRRHRGGDGLRRLDQERRRDRHAARGGDRRHDPRLALLRPGRGAEDGVRDPQGAGPARARAGDDRVPVVRPRQRRRAHARRGGRAAPRRSIRRRSRSRCSAAR